MEYRQFFYHCLPPIMLIFGIQYLTIVIP